MTGAALDHLLAAKLDAQTECLEASVPANSGNSQHSQQGLQKHEVQQQDTKIQKHLLHDETRDEYP
jgi:hypothetical protein